MALFTIQHEFLAFVLERGKFFDAANYLGESFRTGGLAGEVKGVGMEEVRDDPLDASELIEVGGAFDVGDDVEKFVDRGDGGGGALGGANALESGEMSVKAKANRRRRGDPALDLG